MEVTPDRSLAIAAAPSQLWPTQKAKLHRISPLLAHLLKAKQEKTIKQWQVFIIITKNQDPCFCPEWIEGGAWPPCPPHLATPMRPIRNIIHYR